MTSISGAIAAPFGVTADARIEREVEVRECAGKYCTVRFVPNRPEQRFCGRGCSFKALKYSRYKGLWRGISDDRNYRNNWDVDDD